MTEEITKIIRHSITRFLAKREHSRAELIQKLKQKGFEEQACFYVLKQFTEAGIQCDKRFAESLVKSAFNKGKGPRYVVMKLNANQIDESIARPFIASEDYDWFELALREKQRKFGEHAVSDFKEKMKQKRFLLQRGFEKAQIEHATSHQTL